MVESLNVGDVVSGSFWHGGTVRGIVIADQTISFAPGLCRPVAGEYVIREGPGYYFYTSDPTRYHLVPAEQQTLAERVYSTYYGWRIPEIRPIAESDTLDWRLMLQLLPVAEQARMLIEPRPSLALLSVWIAAWFDPKSRGLLPRVASTVAGWEAPDEPKNEWQDYESLAWQVWMSILPAPKQEEILQGSWPEFPELALVAAQSASHQASRYRTLETALARIA